MTSLRKRKKTANALGLTEAELTLAELLDEVLAELRWVKILAYGNQYLLDRHVKVDAAERDKVLEAATRAVEQDGRLHEWQERLAQVRGAAVTAKRAMSRAMRDLSAGRPGRGAAVAGEGDRDG
ncbi:MAG: hypothetical protein HZB39_10005 [Planctomycetes bacterium]|nr:hypothetical protein [Planctomycetota bacterium]